MKKILIILCLLQSVCMAMEFDKNGNYDLGDGLIINDGVFRKKIPCSSINCGVPECPVNHSGKYIYTTLKELFEEHNRKNAPTVNNFTLEIKTNIEPTFEQKIDILKNEIEQLKKQIQELKSNERK